MSRNTAQLDSLLLMNKHHQVSFSYYFIFDRIVCFCHFKADFQSIMRSLSALMFVSLTNIRQIDVIRYELLPYL